MNYIKKITTDKFFRVSLAVSIMAILIFPLSLLVSRGTLTIPNEFQLIGVEISIYGLLIATSIIASLIIIDTIKDKQLEKYDLLFSSLYIIFPAVLFARLWHIATDFELYKGDITEVLRFENGGLSIWGAIVGGFVGVLLFSRLKKISLGLLLNHIVVALPLGQAIGRLGNMFNQELFGPPTDLPWGMYVDLKNRPQEYLNYSYFHPAFLYEATLNLFLFFFLLYAFRKYHFEKDRGWLPFGIYLIGYGIIRFIVEFYRIEDRIFVGLSLNQFVSILFVLIGGIILTMNRYKSND